MRLKERQHSSQDASAASASPGESVPTKRVSTFRIFSRSSSRVMGKLNRAGGDASSTRRIIAALPTFGQRARLGQTRMTRLLEAHDGSPVALASL